MGISANASLVSVATTVSNIWQKNSETSKTQCLVLTNLNRKHSMKYPVGAVGASKQLSSRLVLPFAIIMWWYMVTSSIICPNYCKRPDYIFNNLNIIF